MTLARSRCGHAERVGAQVWLGGRNFGKLSSRWRTLLR